MQKELLHKSSRIYTATQIGGNRYDDVKSRKKRSPGKGKKIKSEGFVTGVLYGKEMKENIALKFEEKEALRFMKDAKKGHRLLWTLKARL